MQNIERKFRKPVFTSKEFDAEYIFGGTWKGKFLVGASTIKCKFALKDIKRYGVKNVIKFYAIKYGISNEKYNCYIADFGKKNKTSSKSKTKQHGNTNQIRA